ncbi:unnamed protein product [Lampetra planeri]
MSLRALLLVLLLLLLGPMSPALCCLRCSPIFNDVRNQLKESIPGVSVDHKKEMYKIITEIGNKEAPILFDFVDVAPVFLKRILDIIDSMRPMVTSYKKDDGKDHQGGMLTEVVPHKEELKPAVHSEKTKKSEKSGSIHHSQHKTPKAVTPHSKKKNSSGHTDSASKHHSKSKTDKAGNAKHTQK